MAFVRAARPDDAPEIARIHLAAWQERYPTWPSDVWTDLVGPDATAAWRNDCTAPPSTSHRILVATDDADRVAGFLTLEPTDEATLAAHRTIGILEVYPECRNQGHGSRLMSAAVDNARKDSAIGLTLWLDQGSPASRFLVDAGWGPRGTRRVLDVGQGVELRQHEWWTSIADA